MLELAKVNFLYSNLIEAKLQDSNLEGANLKDTYLFKPLKNMIEICTISYIYAKHCDSILSIGTKISKSTSKWPNK